MKVAILAGGFGTRLSEETDIRPKPMVEIGGKPILWHIMKHYSSYGFNEFVVLLGYKGYTIKEYFANYYLHQSDITIDTKAGKLTVHSNDSEDWKITLVETGPETMTGGRVKRAEKYLAGETFMLTYGDGVSDVNVKKLVEFHQTQKKILTLTAIQPEGRFGVLDIGAENKVQRFLEKPRGDGSWINGGFFVCDPKIFGYLRDGDKTIFERTPMETLASEGQLTAYQHEGFWKCMDTLRDKQELNQMWASGKAPWMMR
ncbi:MAG: glucose-1-phosphate cytidylyltransferase [Bdellovibrionaceae bacterium]|nr:glucose-1-phosphate cytidylyltransferase [Pseudobdellovibrionaceae bacterium]